MADIDLDGRAPVIVDKGRIARHLGAQPYLGSPEELLLRLQSVVPVGVATGRIGGALRGEFNVEFLPGGPYAKALALHAKGPVGEAPVVLQCGLDGGIETERLVRREKTGRR